MPIDENKSNLLDDLDRSEDHDRYLIKNQSLSRAYDLDKKDSTKKISKGKDPELKTCKKCNQEKMCLPQWVTSTGHFDGATSVYKEVIHVCDDCKSLHKSKQTPEMSPKKIKSLLRNARKGRI